MSWSMRSSGRSTNDMDVINLSLGSAFRQLKDDADGGGGHQCSQGRRCVVVISAGNSGPNQYISGAPGAADGAITVGGE